MYDLQSEIEQCRIKLCSGNFHFTCKKIDNDEAKAIIQTAETTFIIGNPRVWWLGLNENLFYIESHDAINEYEIVSLLLQEKFFYFVPELDEEATGALPIYLTNYYSLRLLLDNLPYFEYYIFDNTFTWIMIENDHDELIIGKMIGS